jgi:sporulation protein YlmC with PRC-barrel domain
MAGNAENIVHTEYSTPYRRVLSADSLSRDCVLNRMNENVGSIKDIMIDLPSGRVAYAVLSVGDSTSRTGRIWAIPHGTTKCVCIGPATMTTE